MSQSGESAVGTSQTVPNQIIRASAGTGKTFRLSNRYIELLTRGHSCDSILATTFTRKAAGEILDRIVQRLASGALDETAASELAGFVNCELDSSRCRELLKGLMKKIHRLQIGTLDSFFSRLARSFSLELGLPLDWSISTNQLLGELSDLSIQEMLSSQNAIRMMHLLAKGEAQRGVAHLIRQTVDDVYGIFLDSQESAWNRLPPPGNILKQDEIDQLIENLEASPANGKQQQTRKDKDLEFASLGEWGDFADSKQFKRILFGGGKFGKKERSAEMVQAYQAFGDHIRAVVIDDLKRRNEATYGLVEEYAKRFKRKQRESGALRFDDVTLSLHSLVGKRDANNRLMFRLDQQIEHLLLDEFQDTSPGQWQVIAPFAHWVAKKNSGRSFFCVGDMKQAIYGWRGGVAEIFDLVDEELENLTACDDMVDSYRSAPEVIEAVNTVFTNLGNVKTECEETDAELQRAAQQFKLHRTKRGELPGRVTLQYGPDCDPSLSRDRFKKLGARNDVMLDQMVQQIAEYHQKCPDRTIGVLTRSNRTVAETIFKLQQAGIEASQEGGNQLTDSAAVETVLAAIQLADHPGDSVARFLVSHSALGPWFHLAPESTVTQKENQERVGSVAAEVRKQLIDEGYGPTVEGLARVLASECTERELTRLQRLIEISYDYDDSWTLRADQFVAYIRDTKVPDESAAKVRVMTVHGSKGLEFDAVFLPIPSVFQWYRPERFVVDRDRPTDPASLVSLYVRKSLHEFLPDSFLKAFKNEDRSKVREELCVLYVALTRAVHAMHIHVSYDCKPNEGRSLGRILLGALAADRPRSPESIVYEIGAADWYLNHQRPIDELAEGLQPFYLDECVEISECDIATAPKSGRGCQWLSPAQLEGESVFSLGNVLRRQQDRERMERGTLLHACFEAVVWLDDGVPTDEVLSESMRRVAPLVSQPQIEEIISEFRDMLGLEVLKELLAAETWRDKMIGRLVTEKQEPVQPFTVRVENERPFAIQSVGGVLEGFIDRLLWLYEGDELVGAEIIDFKSDKAKNGKRDEQVRFYSGQLNAYIDAVATFSELPEEKINAFLVFLETGELVEVEKETGVPAKVTADETQTLLRRGVKRLDGKVEPGKQLRLWD